MLNLLIFIGILFSLANAQGEAPPLTGSWTHSAFQDVQPWEIPGHLSRKEEKALRHISPTAWAEKELIVVVGFWCSDSEKWIPILLKGLQLFPEAKVQFYALDRNKQGGPDWENTLKISHLPTFVVLKSGREIGRITETPESGILWKDFGELLLNR
jgi:hypothetical protein